MNNNNRCVSSQWLIKISKNAVAHQYDTDIVFNPADGRRPRNLTQGSDGYRKKICRYILGRTSGLANIPFAYDGKAITITARQLASELEQGYDIPTDAYLENAFGCEGTVTITMKFARSVNLSDLSAYRQGGNPLAEDRTLRNCLEMILSQAALERDINRFSSVGAGQMSLVTETAFDRGLVYRGGNRKGVHIVHGPQGAQPVLAMDVVTKVFYRSNANFREVVLAFMGNHQDWEEAARLFRGLKLQVIYNPGRILTFRGFTERPIRELEAGDGVPLTEFFHNREIEILYPHDRAAVMMQNAGEFPLELLTVVPDQVVPQSRMPPHLEESALGLNRMRPHERHGAIQNQFTLLAMNNSTSSGFGVSINENMTQGTFHRLEKPTIEARQNQKLQSDDFGVFKFDRNQYLLPGRVNRLIVLATRSNAQRSLECAEALVKEAQSKGVQLPKPEFSEFNTTSVNAQLWINKLQGYQGQRALVVIVDSSRESHDLMKLAEALTGVPTQHIMTRTAEDVVRRRMTRDNVLHKINLKIGGLNHRILFGNNLKKLDLNRGNILVIGLDVCHPTGENCRGPTAEPSIVGITGNYLEQPCAFAGTYFFQAPRQEAIESEPLSRLTTMMLREISKHGRKIDTIVVMRDGVSEGQYDMVVNEELMAIRKGADAFLGHGKVKMVGIIVTKNGNARHFALNGRQVNSLPPRSVVEFGTRENFTQFFMVPHRAFQGTAKAVMVTLIHDDLGLSAADVQNFTLALTNLHQIVCAPTSLPEPIYQADRVCFRGQLVFRAYKRHFPQEIPMEDGELDFATLTTRLSFGGSLPLTRYTA